MSQKAHHLRQCDSSFFLVVTGRLSSMRCAQSSMRARSNESSPIRRRRRDVSVRSESCNAVERNEGAVADGARAATDARNGDSGARNGELGEAERSRDGGDEAGRAEAARRGEAALAPSVDGPALVPVRGAGRADGRTAAPRSTGVARTEIGRTTVGVGVRSGGGGGLPCGERCAVGDGARPNPCVGGATGVVVRGAEGAAAGVTPKAGGDSGVAGRVGGVSHARVWGADDASGGTVRGDAPAPSRGVGGRPNMNSSARARSDGAEVGRVGIGGGAAFGTTTPPSVEGGRARCAGAAVDLPLRTSALVVGPGFEATPLRTPGPWRMERESSVEPRAAQSAAFRVRSSPRRSRKSRGTGSVCSLTSSWRQHALSVSM